MCAGLCIGSFWSVFKLWGCPWSLDPPPPTLMRVMALFLTQSTSHNWCQEGHPTPFFRFCTVCWDRPTLSQAFQDCYAPMPTGSSNQCLSSHFQLTVTLCSPGLGLRHADEGMDIHCTNETTLHAPPMGLLPIFPGCD